MSLFKFQNYSAIKNAQDNPRVVATAITKNGYAFGITDASGAENQGVFADATSAKGDVWVAINVIDKPEIMNTSDYQIEVGEYIRAFNLNKLVGEKVELTKDLVVTAYASVAVGDKLIPCNGTDDATTPMLWRKAIITDTGYNVVLEVTAKTAFGAFTIDGSVAGGFEAKIKSIPATV